MDQNQVLSAMAESKIIPLFYESDVSVAKALVEACYKGGARVIEFTHRGPKAVEVYTELLAYGAELGNDLLIGIGSISSPEQAQQYIDLGAPFLVSPFISKDIFEVAHSNQVFWTGGCGTLTEFQTAYSWGVPLLKLFPGNIYGPGMIKAALAPCPWLKIMPTGGVQPEAENLESWFGAGATCVGIGSKLFIKNEDGSFNLEKIQQTVQYSIGVTHNR